MVVAGRSNSPGLDFEPVIFKPISSGSSGNLYLLRDGDRSLAIECGLRFRDMRRRLDFNLTDLDGLLLSHSHGDHAKAAKDVLAAGVEVFALKKTFEALNVNGHHNAHLLEPLAGIRIKRRWRVLPFDLCHDVPALGFLVEAGGDKIIYVTDTAYVPHRFHGITILAIEANYSEALLRDSDEASKRKMRSLRYHMSIERVLGFLAANDLSSVREIHLLHLSDAHSDEKQFKRLVEEATGKPVFVAGS